MNQIKHLKTLALIAATSLTLYTSIIAKVYAQTTQAPATQASANKNSPEENIKKQLQVLGVKNLQSIEPSIVKGLYEIVADKKVFYSDGGQHLIMGDILNVTQKKNLTEQKREALNKISFMNFPLNQALSWKRGNPSAGQTIIVFSDPNCGHCKQFAKELQQLKDIQVYEFIIPILGADSVNKAKQILCQEKPKQLQAWHELMVKGQMPATVKECKTGVDAIRSNLALMQKLEITGTPTIFFKNGSRIPGSLSAQELQQEIKARQ